MAGKDATFIKCNITKPAGVLSKLTQTSGIKIPCMTAAHAKRGPQPLVMLCVMGQSEERREQSCRTFPHFTTFTRVGFRMTLFWSKLRNTGLSTEMHKKACSRLWEWADTSVFLSTLAGLKHNFFCEPRPWLFGSPVVIWGPSCPKVSPRTLYNIK